MNAITPTEPPAADGAAAGPRGSQDMIVSHEPATGKEL